MLTVRNLTKIYKTKNGADVHALDGVSIQFPEKGMVFLLGKSGSGKSTLLNVCGGLDSPTEGEIVVKGKSSKNFSQSDFDSYRNTYVGFVFQEYNILNEFSVEDNIALALELQGKPKDKKAVAELLEQVDLTGYAKRKPNTLSGGQKQRIAIARALVKSPEIIMADEPTGALDSTTGKQVFETLKKLSQDKLVLVVSHDREFAEQYGDRIIELKDGKILSDVTKAQEQQKEVSQNINKVGNVLCIKQGTTLNEQDFDAIKTFLSRSDSDIIIANDKKDVSAFKKVSRITDDGEKEVFLDTDETKLEKKTYKPEDSKFIRSKLPAKHAVKIGLSSLKSKPIRLFFTIVLCTVAFVLFGLLSTMSFYNSEATFKQTLLDSNHSLLRLKKDYRAKEIVYQNGEQMHEFETYFEARFSQAEIDKIKSRFGEDVFGGIPVFTNYNIRSASAPYWINEISMVAYLPENHSLRQNIMGSYPTGKDEVCISSYMADVIINCKGYDENGNVIDVTTREELLGKKISLDGVAYKVSGILDSGLISEKYEVLKENNADNDQLTYQLKTELGDGLHFTLFVSLDRLQAFADENEPYKGENLLWNRRVAMSQKNSDGKYVFPEWSNAGYDKLESVQGKPILYMNGEKTALSDQEVIVSHSMFANLVMELYSEKINAANENENYDLAEKYNHSLELSSQVMSGGIWRENPDTNKGEIVSFTTQELVQKTQQLMNAIKKDNIKISVGAKLFNDQTQSVYGDLREFSVTGVYVGGISNSEEILVVSDTVLEQWWNEQKVNIDYYSVCTTQYRDEPNALYGTLFLPYDKSQEQTQLFWEMYNNKEYAEDDSKIKPTGVFIDKLEMIDSLVESLSQVFLYVGLVLAVFAALLLSNFISVSISQKKKEIGILRAVGARSLDVFKIFYSESFIISTICVFLASATSVMVCNILNTEVATEFGASLFVFGITSFVIMVLIAVITTIIATILPVWNAAKKKPVESIRSL